MYEPITVDVNTAGTVANIAVPIAGNGTDAASDDALRVLRDEIVPQTVGAVSNTEAGVTGLTASWKDQADELRSNLAPVVAFVLLFAFVLMLVAFRSVVIAGKAIVLNLLSVAAAYGVLVLVFQHGVGNGLLGVSSADGIEAVVPLLLFVILFGLSMDYHVFIISRIREAVSRGESTDGAITHGIRSTAGVVTSAAIVMVCVFAVFGTLSMPFFKQFGVGLAAADPHRRDDRPRGAAAGVDEAARRLELVPAEVARVAPAARLRRARSRAGGRGCADRPSRSRPVTSRGSARSRPAASQGSCSSGSSCSASATSASAPLMRSPCRPARRPATSSLKPCTYGTEDGGYDADCGTLVVPENRADPQSRLIALPVKRIRARSDRPGGADLPAPGRPGHHQHDVPRGEPVRGQTTTSCSSATGAWTAPQCSTAPRWSRR